jgi:hypothetical protein
MNKLMLTAHNSASERRKKPPKSFYVEEIDKGVQIMIRLSVKCNGMLLGGSRIVGLHFLKWSPTFA